MAIADKERCVEFELKITKLEMDINSKNNAIQEMTLDNQRLNEQIDELETKIDHKEKQESSYNNERRINNLEFE